jgi:hypothetical protein
MSDFDHRSDDYYYGKILGPPTIPFKPDTVNDLFREPAMADRTLFLDMSAITVGADPELFLKKGGEFISGDAVPCGSKEKPRKTPHGAVQNDGTALELNIPPSSTKAEFIAHIRNVTADLVEIVHGWDREAMLVAEPVAVFGDRIKSFKPEARQLGCNPDWNAWTGSINPMPDAERDFRTGAGHVHIGWAEGQEGLAHMEKCQRLVRQLDYTIGLRTVLYDTDQRRRQLYGQAGAFRPKPYGCEYRVPSNVWMGDETLAGMIFDGVLHGIRGLNCGIDYEKKYGDAAVAIINSGDSEWPKKYSDLANDLGMG